MFKHRLISVFILVVILICGCAAPAQEPLSTDTQAPTGPPAEIVIRHHNLFPYGMVFDQAGDHFLISSATEGDINIVHDDGTLETFIADEDLQKTVGLEIDTQRNRLLVPYSDQEETECWLAAYDLDTRERLFLVNLSDLYPGESHASYDVAVDGDGNAYVTDFYAPVIYRVDPTGHASIFLEDDGLYYVNSIVYHPDGFLVFSAGGILYRCPLDHPEMILIHTPCEYLTGPGTGFTLDPEGRLIVINAGDMMKVGRLKSTDGWQSVTNDGFSMAFVSASPSTTALRDGDVYVLQSHWKEWFNGEDRDEFEIELVEFQ